MKIIKIVVAVGSTVVAVKRVLKSRDTRMPDWMVRGRGFGSEGGIL